MKSVFLTVSMPPLKTAPPLGPAVTRLPENRQPSMVAWWELKIAPPINEEALSENALLFNTSVPEFEMALPPPLLLFENCVPVIVRVP